MSYNGRKKKVFFFSELEAKSETQNETEFTREPLGSSEVRIAEKEAGLIFFWVVTHELFFKLPLILSPKKEPFLEFGKWVLVFKLTQPEAIVVTSKN